MNQIISKLLAHITFQRRKGNDREANDLRQKELHIAETAEDKDFTPIAEALVNELVGFGHVNQAQQAEPFYTRLLSLTEQRLGPEHILTLKAKKNLATVYAYQSRFQDAASLTEQILPILIRELGAQDAEVMNTIDNLTLSMGSPKY